MTRYLRTFLPWIAFAVFAGDDGDRIGAPVAAAIAIGLIALDLRAGRRLPEMVLELSSALFFTGLSVAAYAIDPAPFGDYGTAVSSLWLAATAWLSIALRRPFTLAIARTMVPADLHANPHFVRANVVITAVWAASFTVEAGVLALLTAEAPGLTGVILAVKAASFAVPAYVTVRMRRAGERRRARPLKPITGGPAGPPDLRRHPRPRSLTMSDPTVPSHLTGVKAPVPDEASVAGLRVTGTLPAELSGRYFRNGPNPLPGARPGHWFAGDGMVHGVRIRDGRAEWYRNRWVRTKALDGVPMVTEKGVDLTAVSANTSVVEHAGRIFALVESGFPHELTPDLDTIGPCDFGGRLTTAMTAHPKEDPLTGELHFFGYGFAPPFLTYHRLSADGELVHSGTVDVPGPTMMHDFAITSGHVVWLDLPVVFDRDRLGRGMPYAWSDDYGARIGLMRHDGTGLRWFEVEPGYVFHTGNAYEDALGRVVVEGMRYSPAAFTEILAEVNGAPTPENRLDGAFAHRWVLDPATGKASEDRFGDAAVEFPTFNDTVLGTPSRYLYAVADTTVTKYDTANDTVATRDVTGTGGRDATAGEAVYVPRAGTAGDPGREDDGWLMSLVSWEEDRADLVVLDAQSLETVASVALPRRVPLGFHGEWLAD